MKTVYTLKSRDKKLAVLRVLPSGEVTWGSAKLAYEWSTKRGVENAWARIAEYCPSIASIFVITPKNKCEPNTKSLDDTASDRPQRSDID